MPTDAQQLSTIRANQTQVIIPELGTLQALLLQVVSSVSAIQGILKQQGTLIMAFSDDLAALATQVTAMGATLTNVESGVQALSSESDTLLADLQTALANSAASADPAIQDAVTKITNFNSRLATLNVTLQQAVARDAPP